MLRAHVQREQDVLPVLHPEEQARYRTFTHPHRRQTWLAGRALLLASLARQFGRIDATALRTDPDGGVRYHAAPVHLSLSHCRDLIAVAISSVRVGVDIEWPRPRALLRDPAQVFHPFEAAYLQSLPESQRQDAFYMFWTLKEAACKSAGTSLLKTLRSTCFDIAAARFSSEAPFPSGAWRFMSARIEPGWRLALVISDSGKIPHIESWRLLAATQWDRQLLAGQVFLQGK